MFTSQRISQRQWMAEFHKDLWIGALCVHFRYKYSLIDFKSRTNFFCLFLDIYVMPISTKQFVYEIKSSLKLRGDIFINFYHVNNKSLQTTVISSLQFHTCAISNTQITFNKADLNLACDGERCFYITYLAIKINVLVNWLFHTFEYFCR